MPTVPPRWGQPPVSLDLVGTIDWPTCHGSLPAWVRPWVTAAGTKRESLAGWVGGSGRRWTYEAMLAELPNHPGSSLDAPRFEPSDISGVLLAPGLVHLTFETMLGELRTRHSSIWRKGDEAAGWRMYYHQATRVPFGVE